jgi:hypothetical protein
MDALTNFSILTIMGLIFFLIVLTEFSYMDTFAGMIFITMGAVLLILFLRLLLKYL